MTYKIIKYCRMCKARFVVQKGESKKAYCDKCQKAYQKNQEKKAKEEKDDE